MNDHFTDIFTETACPTQDQLLAYVENKLSPAERHEVERHIADCELCSEAVEGLAAITHKERIPGWLRQAKWDVLQKLRKKTRKKRKEHYYLYIAVISLLILFLAIAVFWLYHFSSR